MLYCLACTSWARGMSSNDLQNVILSSVRWNAVGEIVGACPGPIVVSSEMARTLQPYTAGLATVPNKCYLAQTYSPGIWAISQPRLIWSFFYNPSPCFRKQSADTVLTLTSECCYSIKRLLHELTVHEFEGFVRGHDNFVITQCNPQSDFFLSSSDLFS